MIGAVLGFPGSKRRLLQLTERSGRKTVTKDPDFGDRARLIDQLQKEAVLFAREMERAVS